MTHFTDVEIHRWRADGPGADRDRVLHHTGECAACAARYAAALRAAASANDLERIGDVAEFVEAGYRVGAPASPSAWRWIVPLAAAAVVLLAVVVPRWRTEPAVATAPTLRGASVQALEPAGVVTTPDLRFVWSAGVSAGRFRIDVSDANGVVASAEASGSPWTMAAADRERLKPGVDYQWSVTALDAAGAPIASSSRRPFTIAPR